MHTYRTIAQRIGVDKIEARLLLDHTVAGIDGVYIHEKAVFDRLLHAQERISAAILNLVQGKPSRQALESFAPFRDAEPRPREQEMAFVYGRGRDGKGVCIRALRGAQTRGHEPDDGPALTNELQRKRRRCPALSGSERERWTRRWHNSRIGRD
jgi:hypothetical protein